MRQVGDHLPSSDAAAQLGFSERVLIAIPASQVPARSAPADRPTAEPAYRSRPRRLPPCMRRPGRTAPARAGDTTSCAQQHPPGPLFHLQNPVNPTRLRA